MSKKLAAGSTLSNAWPLESMRFAGTILPGNGVRLLFGSCTTMSALFTSRDCEKLPPRSSAVGTVCCPIAEGIVSGQNSCDQKKNSLSLLELNFPGQ